jgi:hypothetical protein
MGIGLSSSELTDIRTAINELLPTSATILTNAATPDGYGGFTEGTAVRAGGTYTCRIDPIRGQEQNNSGAINSFHTYVLTLPYTATVMTNDKVSSGTAIYNVTSIDSGKSWNASVRVIMELV